jgi:hypothetical protein
VVIHHISVDKSMGILYIGISMDTSMDISMCMCMDMPMDIFGIYPYPLALAFRGVFHGHDSYSEKCLPRGLHYSIASRSPPSWLHPFSKQFLFFT